jgi:insertion element IS1 protein InsB
VLNWVQTFGPQLAVALDERWSFAGAKEKARWLWHALDYHTGRVLAYVVGTRKDAMFLKHQAFLSPFGITRY